MSPIITVDPDIRSSKPVIAGTRIMVKNLPSLVAGGYDMKRILATYPELSAGQVESALEYAANVINE